MATLENNLNKMLVESGLNNKQLVVPDYFIDKEVYEVFSGNSFEDTALSLIHI